MKVPEHSMNARFVKAPLLAIAVVWVAGCNGEGDARRWREISKFGVAYLSYHKANGVSPSQPRDLENSKGEFPELWKEIEDGRFVVLWSALLDPDDNWRNRLLLGYPNDGEENGGLVLTADGNVEHLSPKQFSFRQKIPVLRGTKAELARMREILNLGRAYHTFATIGEESNIGPSGLKDLEKAKESFPELWKEIEDGRFLVLWHAKLIRGGNASDRFLLGYPKDAEVKGGLVLKSGGSWEQMSAEDFRKTPKIETVKR